MHECIVNAVIVHSPENTAMEGFYITTDDTNVQSLVSADSKSIDSAILECYYTGATNVAPVEGGRKWIVPNVSWKF